MASGSEEAARSQVPIEVVSPHIIGIARRPTSKED